MEDIWTIVITVVILIVSALVGSKKKKTESGKEIGEESPLPPFSFFEEEEELEEVKKPVVFQKKHFTYDDISSVEEENFVHTIKENDEVNDSLSMEQDREAFDIEKAIIYSEILKRPYN